jgi:hypothetical protein
MNKPSIKPSYFSPTDTISPTTTVNPTVNPTLSSSPIAIATMKPTLLSQADAISKSSSDQLSMETIGLIVALVIICLLVLIISVMYYYCYIYSQEAEGAKTKLHLREWIHANKENVDVIVFESPKYRESVLEPRASEFQTNVPTRLSVFNQNPFTKIAFRSHLPDNPKTEGDVG